MTNWCKDAGGHWITSRGNHLCISDERELNDLDNSKVSVIIHDEGITTRFRRDGKVSDELATEVKSTLLSYPMGVKKDIKSVEVHTGYIGETTLGVNIPVKGRSAIIVTTVKDPIYTLHHEIGHEVWREKIRGKTSPVMRWSAISSKPGHPTSYAKVSEEEDFAESLAMFKTDPGKLKKLSVDRYVFVSEVMGEY